MKLLGTKVAVRQEVSALKTAGGLELPSTMQQKLPQGEVIAVGHQIEADQRNTQGFCTLKVGDHVLFNNFAVQGVIVDGVELAIIDVTDIQVIL